jgi:hypothetical protein
MKKQDSMTPPKVNNYAITDTKDSEVDEILEEKFKRTAMRMINMLSVSGLHL